MHQVGQAKEHCEAHPKGNKPRRCLNRLRSRLTRREAIWQIVIQMLYKCVARYLSVTYIQNLYGSMSTTTNTLYERGTTDLNLIRAHGNITAVQQ